MRLAIVVGHDSKSKGAYATAPLKQYEYDYNIGVAEFAYRKAMSLGMGCRIFLRNKIGIKGVYSEVEKWADDNTVCVELHFNSSHRDAYGTETFFDNKPLESVDLARYIHEQVVSVFKRTGKGNRGIKLIDLNDNKYDRGEFNFEECDLPMCLTEPFFGSNSADSDLGMKYKVQYAEAIVVGVMKYFKEREARMQMN